jgi:2-C-methyl-D-erythritol 4-phosphate cytidylyltransferase
MKHVAIVLAAGQGKRMNSPVSKQYLQIQNKPILCYCLDVLEQSFIDEVILVVGKNEIDFCKNEILMDTSYSKLTTIVEGGKERYHSVMEGIRAIKDCSYVYIHDGARPFLSLDILERMKEQLLTEKACIPAVPVKDTIKVITEKGFVESTPDRSRLWQIQTPQGFSFSIIKDAYGKLLLEQNQNPEEFQKRIITDDAMVVESYLNIPVKIVEGTYQNIKITTSEDLKLAEIYLQDLKK